ncbi:efflux RND transporter permease subunit [Terasakiella sp. A23]|uniref:efflux RND transporter permease subunit n=1 Tax=Terasakiella sp. FCG-A23 TaxID=3080561 RepID=UPI002952A189|nr:efflux RND transporter permease subunit [Terasakiella sp. A23]MDV7338013.1 efflux RND transporter permease subunit [Terasakiella sp. A23]
MTQGHNESRFNLVSLFTRHRTAPNLLMFLMILLGVVSLTRLNVQFFPNFGIDVITVNVTWSGAGAEDVDANIVQALEPELRFLDNIKHVKSTSNEGSASISIEFEAGTEMQTALSNVETAVAQVTTLPEDSEKPVINRVTRYEPISRLLLSGPYPESALKAMAKELRDDLLARGVDKVDLNGARDEEIWVEVLPETLRRLDMTIGDIANRISQISQDIPAGETGGAQAKQIRGLGEVKTAEGVASIEVRARENGEKLKLSDIARVSERFDADGAEVRFDQMQAIELQVRRSTTADALEVDDIVTQFLKDVRPTLPANVRLEQYEVQANLIRDRIDLLLSNGLSGLVLVLAILFLFLNTRVAFWVAVGIPVSILATLFVMALSGQTINMISLFGLIMAIGIVVDDAIVVGEHSETLRRRGLSPVEAAEAGALRMLVPVFASSLTTIAAFMPLLAISDIMGQIIAAIPFVAIAVIIASLIECFFVLPGHMRHALKGKPEAVTGFRKRFNDRFDHFRDTKFTRFIEQVLEYRYTAIAMAFGALIICIGLVAGGRVGFQFFKGPEAERIFANVEMVAGTPRLETQKMVDELEKALLTANAALGGDLVVTHVAKVGTRVSGSAAHGGGKSSAGSDHLGGIYVELVASDAREVRTDDFTKEWREQVKMTAGLERLTLIPVRAGPPGRDVDIRIQGDNIQALKAASLDALDLLKRYPGVSALEDDLPFGKEEAILELSPHGKALGFTTEDVARQVRNSFDGAIAKRFPRGDEEVLIRVQFDRAHISQTSLDELYIRSPAGAEVPLSQVANLRSKNGFATIKREDGIRQVSITGEINKSITSTDLVINALKRDGIDELARKHNVHMSFAGKAEEQKRTFGDMITGVIVGFSAIYIILAWVFSSYSKPIVVMSVIPFGFVGATVGHYVMGFDLTMLSLVALVGLSGIVVNDSIILVSTVKEHLDMGKAPLEAIKRGTVDRLRAVILTSATTICGLTPLMFETSLQAQFLIPMAITLVFGLMVATLLVLVLIPALLAVLEDLKGIRGIPFLKKTV